MTPSQKYAAEASALRDKLNRFATKPEDLTEAERVEVREATEKLSSVEAKMTAALVTEQKAESAETHANGLLPDAEHRERVALASRARCVDFLLDAVGEKPLDGASAELRAATKVKPGVIPWEAIEPRAVAVPAIGSGESQAVIPTLGKIFAQSDITAMGVQTLSVPAGQPLTPIVSGSPDAAEVAKDASITDGTLTITTRSGSPHRVGIRTSWTLEDSASWAGNGLEQVVRTELANSFADQVDRIALTGSGTIKGLLSGETDYPTIPADVSTGAAATFAQIVSAVSTAVDGINANSLSDLFVMISPQAWTDWQAQFAALDSPVTAAAFVGQQTRGLRVSARMPVKAGQNHTVLVTRRNTAAYLTVFGGGMRVIVDPYTDSDKGQTRITMQSLMDLVVARTDGFVALKLRATA